MTCNKKLYARQGLVYTAHTFDENRILTSNNNCRFEKGKRMEDSKCRKQENARALNGDGSRQLHPGTQIHRCGCSLPGLTRLTVYCGGGTNGSHHNNSFELSDCVISYHAPYRKPTGMLLTTFYQQLTDNSKSARILAEAPTHLKPCISDLQIHTKTNSYRL